MSYSDEGYRNMIASFRTNDLQALLSAFGSNKNGRKSELKDRALDLLRSRQPNFSHQAYITKIVEIYRSMSNEGSRNNDLIRNMIQSQQRQQQQQQQQQQMMTMSMNMQSQTQVQQQRMYQPPQYSQPPSSMHMTRAGLPQVMPQMQRNMYGSTITGGSGNIQYAYQPSSSRSMVSQMPTNQQLGMVPPDPMVFDINAPTSTNTFSPSTQSLANISLKKLPFYEVVAEVIKPTILVGQERCTLQNVPRGMREATFKLTILPEHVNELASSRDYTGGKNELVYQMQLRICLFEEGATQINDYMPLGLHIRISNKVCPLPPTAPNTRPGTEARRTPRPINCTQVLKLNPNIINPISINWSPDGKTYVMAMYLVKKLSWDTLLQKLHDKGARSSEETKNYIIKKLTDLDPDLATTSYRFSLVCPLGKMRMKIPAKSIHCDHLQCFDASIFILMNEKKPTWMCPTCSKPCLYDDIQIENYFLEVVSSPTLVDGCKEIELLADGTWKVYVESEEVKNLENASESKNKPIDSVNLDDSDDGGNDENVLHVKKELKPESTKESENLKSTFVDLTLSDDDNDNAGGPLKENYKQENEAQAADVQSAATVDLKPQVQPQQAVTSSEQGVVIEIDSPSPPSSPAIPTTSAS